MKPSHRLFALPLLLSAVAISCDSMSQHRNSGAAQTGGIDPFGGEFVPPPPPASELFQLLPLGPDLVELDYDTVRQNAELLRRTLQWNGWPAETLTLGEDRESLARHELEFQNGEAFAYAVMTPDGSRVLGSVYIEPLPAESRSEEPGVAEAMTFFWVAEDTFATWFDLRLVESLLAWFESDWPFVNVLFPIRVENTRGQQILGATVQHFEPSADGDHRVYVWNRSAR